MLKNQKLWLIQKNTTSTRLCDILEINITFPQPPWPLLKKRDFSMTSWLPWPIDTLLKGWWAGSSDWSNDHSLQTKVKELKEMKGKSRKIERTWRTARTTGPRAKSDRLPRTNTQILPPTSKYFYFLSFFNCFFLNLDYIFISTPWSQQNADWLSLTK